MDAYTLRLDVRSTALKSIDQDEDIGRVVTRAAKRMERNLGRAACRDDVLKDGEPKLCWEFEVSLNLAPSAMPVSYTHLTLPTIE